MNVIASRLRAAARAVLRGPGAPAFDATRYWETRYSSGGNSGEGSYGALADFKARVLNEFLADRSVSSAVEFGCGDGHQLSLIAYPAYIGLDVSRSALERCIAQYGRESTKSFFLYDPAAFHDGAGVFRADVALSLDVIYHIVSDTVFERYMTHLCDAAGRFLIVYSTNVDEVETEHVRHREFSTWIAKHKPELALTRVIDNPYAGAGPQQSNASFFMFERLGAAGATSEAVST